MEVGCKLQHEGQLWCGSRGRCRKSCRMVGGYRVMEIARIAVIGCEIYGGYRLKSLVEGIVGCKLPYGQEFEVSSGTYEEPNGDEQDSKA
ncbi:unnamed protein product [Dovyalis caffra]|uniref:Uncharacterized protein n=1 Tax=Dovyalis caffra TaxID=77055 RepID=A0AAV1RFE5_9ROSI|nr:unnamed protein product [Dovyalis caffra]